MSDLLLINPFTGQERPSWVYQATDILIKKMKNEGLWKTMDFYFQIWLKTKPEEAKRFNEARQELTDSRRNRTATFKNKSNRLLTTMPGQFIEFAEKYFPEELGTMGTRNFHLEMAKRYPIFKVPEAI